MSSLLFPLLILALLVPMFLGMRKQKKALAATSEMQDSLQVGDRVQTTAGSTPRSLPWTTTPWTSRSRTVSSPPGRVWSSVSASSRRPRPTSNDDDSISEIEESAADTEIRLTKES